MKRFVALLVIFSVIMVSATSQAQTSSMSGVRRNVATIIFCGLGGAVLGLSTLSFYGKPQENIGNITTGFGLGLIAGTVYVTSQTAQEQSFSLHDQHQRPLFGTLQKQRPPEIPMISMAFNF